MRKIKPIPTFILLGGFFMLFSGHAMAKIQPYRDSLAGPFSTGANYIVQDLNYSVSGVYIKSVQNTVALRLLDNVLISSAFSYTVSLQVQYYTYSSPTTPVTVSTSLTVNYVPGQGLTYKGLDIYSLTGAYKIQVTVTGSSFTGITPPAGSVQLTTEVLVDRSYPFSSTQVIAATYSVAANARQLLASWSAINSADEYDVEWTTINTGNSNFALIRMNINTNSNPGFPTVSAAIAQCFRNNASRITTTTTSCSISLMSTDSILLVRVRQAQYDPVTGVRVAGNWDYNNATKYGIWLLNWNEQNQNWQYSAAFAEDGKKKEVISYFDGTLRGRQ